MLKDNLFIILVQILCVLTSGNVNLIQNERLCANTECSEPISHARSLLKFSSSTEHFSMKRGAFITIFSKNVPEEGKNGKWEVQVDGTNMRGFVDPTILTEFKKLTPELVRVSVKKSVDKKTEKPSDYQFTPPIGVAAELGDGGSPATPYEVIDGTTVPFGTDGNTIEPSMPEESIMKTTIENSPPISPSAERNVVDSVNEEEDEDDDEDEIDENEDEEGEDGDDTSEESPEPSVPVATSREGNKGVNIDIISSLASVIDEALNSEPGKSPEIDAIMMSKSSAKANLGIRPTSTSNLAENEEKTLIETNSPSDANSPEPYVSHSNTLQGDTFEQNESVTIPQPIVNSESVPDDVLPDNVTNALNPESPVATSSPQTPIYSPYPAQILEKSMASEVEQETLVTTPLPESLTQSTTFDNNAQNIPSTYVQEEKTENTVLSEPLLLSEQTSNVQGIESASTVIPSEPLVLDPVVTVPTDSNELIHEQIQSFPLDENNVDELNHLQNIHTEPSHIHTSQLFKDQTASDSSHFDSTTINSEDLQQMNTEESKLNTAPTVIPGDPGQNYFTQVAYQENATPSIPLTEENATTDNPLTVENATPDNSLTEENDFSQFNNITDEVVSDSGLEVGTPEDQQEEKGETEESPGMFSGISNFFSTIMESTGNEETKTEASVNEPENVNVAANEGSDEKIAPEGECKSIVGLESGCVDAPSPDHLWEFFDYKPAASSSTFLYLIVTAVTVLLFTLGHYFIERSRQDRPLIAKVNQLTHDLQVATTQLEARGVQDSLTLSEVSNEALVSLQAELEDLRRVKAELDIQLESQQQELEAATEAGLELNKMLSDLLTQKEGSDQLLLSVDQLQGQLDSQQRIIDEMNRNLLDKSTENQNLQEELLASQDKVDNLEEEINDMRHNLDLLLKEKEDITLALESRNKKLENEVAILSKAQATEVSTLEETLADLTKKLSIRDSEFKALTETIEELRSKGDIDPSLVYDVGHTKAELSRAEQDKANLQERLGEEEGARKLLEDHIKTVDLEVARLRLSYEAAEKDKAEAETRLAVLSNYFKEKETQLQKELGLQEAMWAQKQGDDTTIFERIKSLQDEVENYNFDSFPQKNEDLSISTSNSSVCNEPGSSLPNLHLMEPIKTDSVSSLPKASKRMFKILSRRKSSADFESRLERAELMTSEKNNCMISRPIPDDLLKLQELKTVRASPFRDSSIGSDSMSEKTSAEEIITLKCSEIVEKFESYNKQPKLLKLMNECIDGRILNKKKCVEVPSSECNFKYNKEFSWEPIVSEDSVIKSQLEPHGVVYEVRAPSPNTGEARPSPTRRSNVSPAKSESEDSQSFGKDTELESSATVELDIKVVANAMSNVKKLKRSSRQKEGSQNEILKKEIIDQERGLKGQIATLEKKAHENWVAARQAERRLEESKQEAGQLRNMLTLIEKTSDGDAKTPGRLPGELNGDDPVAPILNSSASLLPFPPLPLDPLTPPPLLPPNFLPPPPFMLGMGPPPPYLPGDRRPAPLGRMSSPPLNSRYSPAPGDYNYDRMSPTRNYRSPPIDADRLRHRTPPSPSLPSRPWEDAPPRGFRPVTSQRDSRRNYPGSNLSSGHSSNDSLDKSTNRHGGKV